MKENRKNRILRASILSPTNMTGTFDIYVVNSCMYSVATLAKESLSCVKTK